MIRHKKQPVHTKEDAFVWLINDKQALQVAQIELYEDGSATITEYDGTKRKLRVNEFYY